MMYDSVEQALSRSYAVAGSLIYKGPSFFESMRGSTVRGETMTPWDRLADACNVIAMCDDVMTVKHQLVVKAHYTSPAPLSIKQKIQYTSILSAYLYTHQCKQGNRFFIMDVVREWTGLKRHHTDTWWAEHMGCKSNTIHYLKLGRKNRPAKGIVEVLDSWLYVAHRECEIPLINNGLIA